MSTRDLKVIEIYGSIQGESSWAGLPCGFVRLAGCDLRCVWCDSEYTFTGGSRMTIAEIRAAVDTLGVSLVEITGGEPMLHAATPDLCRALLDAGYDVLLETGGHRRLDAIDERVIKIVDVKCPGSGEVERATPVALADLTATDEVKFVLADRADYEWAVPRARELVPRVKHVLFSPVWGRLDPEQLVRWIREDQLPVRLNLQLHKYVWGEERGR